MTAAGETRLVDERIDLGPCKWTEDDEGCWDTGCGNKFYFNDGTPEENGCRFCHYCGHPVVATRYVDPPIEDEGESEKEPGRG